MTDIQERGQQRFEDQRVKLLLQGLGLTRHLRSLLDDCEQHRGDRFLSFESLHRLFPEFPLMLASHHITGLASICSPANLFRRFQRTPILMAYLEVYAKLTPNAGDRPIGMVIPFGGCRGGMLVHNGSFATRSPRLTYFLPEDAPPHVLTLERFSPFIEFLAARRHTAEASTANFVATRPQSGPLASFSELDVHRFGPGPALVLLAWLRDQLASPPEGIEGLSVVQQDGDRCLAATHEKIAENSGLSLPQVKRALGELREKGAAASKRIDGGSLIWMTGD